MTAKQDYAIQGFYNGHNCAQSVILAYANEFNMNTSQALTLASTFGGGMGRLQKTCGAVTGAYMVIGIRNSSHLTQATDIKHYNVKMVQKFQQEFVKVHGSDECGQLLKVDLSTDEGQKEFDKQGLKDTVCSNCVKTSVQLLECFFSQAPCDK